MAAFSENFHKGLLIKITSVPVDRRLQSQKATEAMTEKGLHFSSDWHYYSDVTASGVYLLTLWQMRHKYYWSGFLEEFCCWHIASLRNFHLLTDSVLCLVTSWWGHPWWIVLGTESFWKPLVYTLSVREIDCKFKICETNGRRKSVII